MQIEMVETTRGPLPRVALDRREVVVQDDDDATTVQVNWHLIATDEIVKQDGRVDYKRLPADLAMAVGFLRAEG